MRKYDSYKESGINYINEIPMDWEIKPLYTLFNEVKDKNKGNLEKNVLSLSYGNIKKRDIESNMGLLPDSFETYNRIKKDDIVLRLTDLQNDKRSLRTGLVKENGIITSAYVTLRRQSETINAEYAQLLLHAYDVKKVFYNLGAGVRQSMGFAELKKIDLLLPSKNEQNKIVEFLTKKITEIDMLVNNLGDFNDKLEQQRQSIITEAVTKSLNPKVKMKNSGVEWIGEIPEHWKIKKLKYFVSTVKGYAFKSEWFTEDGIRVVKTTDIKDGTTINLSNTYISKAKSLEFEKVIVAKNDILMSTVGSAAHVVNSAVGQLGLVGEEFDGALLNQNAVKLVGKESIVINKYLFYFLNNKWYREYLNIGAHGTANQASLSLDYILDFVSILPSLEEQREIVDHIDSKLNKIATISFLINKQIEKLKEYRQALIYEAVTGKIDVFDMELD